MTPEKIQASVQKLNQNLRVDARVSDDPNERGTIAWAEKSGVKDPEHLLLPRSTGMFFCLNELRGTIDYVYDCTVAYEGIPYVHALLASPPLLGPNAPDLACC